MRPPADEDHENELPLQPENIFDVSDVTEALAALCDIPSPAASQEIPESTQ